MSFFSPCVLHFSQLVPVEGCQRETPSSAAATRHLRSPGSGGEKARAALKLDTKTSTQAKTPPSTLASMSVHFALNLYQGRWKNRGRVSVCLSATHSLYKLKLSLSVFLSSKVRVPISSPTFLPGCKLFDAGAALPTGGYDSGHNGLWDGCFIVFRLQVSG